MLLETLLVETIFMVHLWKLMETLLVENMLVKTL